MCGIVAVLSHNGPVSTEALDRAVRTLRHRGPDGQQTWIAEDRHVALGHARLSIIDLVTGDQPIANEDESAWIVANGEFYDYERVQRELERDGHRLRTRSDSEIALHFHAALRGSGLRRGLGRRRDGSARPCRLGTDTDQPAIAGRQRR